MRLLLSVAILLSAVPLLSQSLPGGQYDNYEAVRNVQNSEPSAILSAKYKHIVNSDYSMNDLGLEFGFFATKDLVVGGHYYYLFDKSVVFDIEDGGPKGILKLDYFGANVDYFITESRSLPISVGLDVGLGKMTYSNYTGVSVNSDLAGDWVSYIEPEANLYYYITPTVLASFNLGYRFMSGVDYKNLSNSDVSGLAGGLGVSIVFY